MRRILLHYHLFKNAGTSVDAFLRDAFCANWAACEFEDHPTRSASAIAEWISQNPTVSCLSTHTVFGPLPEVPGVEVIPIIFLRHPIDRIGSAYRFECFQKSNSYGARLAKKVDFSGYVRARLLRSGDRQCRNFQVHRLASFTTGPSEELSRAIVSLNKFALVGIVEDFNRSMQGLEELLSCNGFPVSPATRIRKNVSNQKVKTFLPPSEMAQLLQENQNDLTLWKVARARNRAAHSQDGQRSA